MNCNWGVEKVNKMKSLSLCACDGMIEGACAESK